MEQESNPGKVVNSVISNMTNTLAPEWERTPMQVALAVNSTVVEIFKAVRSSPISVKAMRSMGRDVELITKGGAYCYKNKTGAGFGKDEHAAARRVLAMWLHHRDKITMAAISQMAKNLTAHSQILSQLLAEAQTEVEDAEPTTTGE